jgi:uncharacterized protein involved in exopolysaccharide biosynthesis
LISILIGGLGVLYAFTAREEYVSEGKILPELQSKTGGLGQFSSLAALAGVDISSMSGGGADAVRPDLYPDVLKSTPFFLELFKLKVKTKENKELLFADFYTKYVLDGKVNEKDLKLNFPISDEYVAVNYQTEKNLKDLRQRITATLDKKTGVIAISVKLPDPVVAAIVARHGMDYLAKYIIDYRTEKAKKDLQFLADRLESAKGKYYTNQAQKAQYSDQMPLNVLKLQSADLQRERIESEYKISSSFYNSLLQKYEEAKIKIQQETPVLKILEPPVVRNKREEPKRTMIVLVALFLGTILGSIFALLRKNNYKEILLKA